MSEPYARVLVTQQDVLLRPLANGRLEQAPGKKRANLSSPIHVICIERLLS